MTRRPVGNGPVGLRLVELLLVAENDGAWCPSATAAADTAARASATAAAREASATAASAAADARTAAKALRKTRFVEPAATTTAADARSAASERGSGGSRECERGGRSRERRHPLCSHGSPFRVRGAPNL
jgi:hypothetical protein